MKLKTYCLACRKHTGNICSKSNYGKSRCAQCLSDKSRFMKQNHNKKVVRSIIKQTR